MALRRLNATAGGCPEELFPPTLSCTCTFGTSAKYPTGIDIACKGPDDYIHEMVVTLEGKLEMERICMPAKFAASDDATANTKDYAAGGRTCVTKHFVPYHSTSSTNLRPNVGVPTSCEATVDGMACAECEPEQYACPHSQKGLILNGCHGGFSGSVCTDEDGTWVIELRKISFGFGHHSSTTGTPDDDDVSPHDVAILFGLLCACMFWQIYSACAATTRRSRRVRENNPTSFQVVELSERHA